MRRKRELRVETPEGRELESTVVVDLKGATCRQIVEIWDRVWKEERRKEREI
jgi:hypothetical protein